MSNKRTRLPKGRRHPLSAETAREMVGWLRAKQRDLEHALGRMREMRRIAPDQDWIARQVDYYCHAIGCAKWLIHHAGLAGRLHGNGGPDAAPDSRSAG